MAKNTFSPSTKITSAKVNENFTDTWNGTNLDDDSIVNRHIKWTTMPMGILRFTNAGGGGGQVISVTTDTELNFETFESNDQDIITKDSNGRMAVSEDGFYFLNGNTGCVDVDHDELIKFQYSSNGTTWNDVTEWSFRQNVIVSRSNNISSPVYLSAGDLVRMNIYVYTQTRIGYDTSASPYESSLMIMRIG